MFWDFSAHKLGLGFLFLKQLFLRVHGSHQHNLEICMQLAFPGFTFEWVAYFFPAVLYFFSDWPKMGADVVSTCWKLLDIIFTLKKKPDISSFRLCEFLISQWPSNTSCVTSDNRNQGETLWGKPQIYWVFRNWWPHVLLACDLMKCRGVWNNVLIFKTSPRV